MGLLPLIHFLRELTNEIPTEQPPLRACFMFDDPNLHWSSFGFINYQTLLVSAIRHDYHASFATVPLDSWYIHRPTARLFCENPARLSFLIHGNNHTREELARDLSESQRTELAAQGLRRISALEKRSGVPISRVMAAPHGACSEAMGDTMLRLGYEAASISRGSLMYYNPKRAWQSATGLRPAEFVGSGFPIIPRLRLSGNRQTEIILAAFLGLPIILVGHHDDLQNGCGILEDLADFINGMGHVSWMNLSEIARSNYRMSRSQGVTEITMFSRHAKVQIPEGTVEIRLRRPWLGRRTSEPFSVLTADGKQDTLMTATFRPPARIEGSYWIEIRCPVTEPVDCREVASPPPPVWALIRRVLAEGRDRLRPILRRSRPVVERKPQVVPA